METLIMLGKGKAQQKAGVKLLRGYTRFQAKKLIAAYQRNKKGK